MINIPSFQSYDILFNSLKQLPYLSSSGFSNVAGAYMAAKYGRSMNDALSSDLSSVMKSFRVDTLSLNKEAKKLTVQTDRSVLKTSDNVTSGFTTSTQVGGKSTIRIDQLASKQTNQGTLLTAKQKTTLAPGQYELNISSSNKNYSLSIAVQTGESNSSVLNKTAKAINKLDSGVKARIASDALGNQQLILESEKTGNKSEFTVSGSLSDAFSLNQTTQAATDAKFNYNGKDYETDSNSVTLDYGKTQLELKSTTSTPVSLDRTADNSGLKDNIASLVSAYNGLQDSLKANSSNKALKAFSDQLGQLVSKNASSLERFGITRNTAGGLEIDEKQLEQGIADSPDEARELFVDKGSLTDTLQSKTDQMLKIPASNLLNLPKATAASSPYQMINSGFINQLSISSQSSGSMFDLLL